MPSPASKGTHHVGRLLVIILEGNNLVCSKDGKVKVIAIETVFCPCFCSRSSLFDTHFSHKWIHRYDLFYMLDCAVIYRKSRLFFKDF